MRRLKFKRVFMISGLFGALIIIALILEGGIFTTYRQHSKKTRITTFRRPKKVVSSASADIPHKSRMKNVVDRENGISQEHNQQHEEKVLPIVTFPNSESHSRKVSIASADIPRKSGMMDGVDRDNGISHKHHQHEEKLLPILTFADSESMKFLRELVASIHVLRNDSFDVHSILVFGHRLSQRESNEIKLWRNVDLYDMEDDLLLDPFILERGFKANEPLPEITQVALQFALRKNRVALYVQSGMVFTIDSLHTIEERISHSGKVFMKKDADNFDDHMNLPVIGLSMDFPDIVQTFLSHPIQCMRGFQCDTSSLAHLKEQQAQMQPFKDIQEISTAGIKPSDGAQVYFCNLLLRFEAIFKYHRKRIHSSPLKGKPIIALGMPTLTVLDLEKTSDVATIRIFLPSLLKTVTAEEWTFFNFRLYIGFDEGDKFYDNSEYQAAIVSEIDNMIKGYPITLHLVKFPYSKGWVTFLWNGLFVQAISEGADYFYQVNDDVELIDAGWATAFTNKLHGWGNFGVVGPRDSRWGHLLLTQAFVHKTHYEIFGRLYPHEIKDWHSDDWLTLVYGGNYTCQFREYMVINHNDKGTRYQGCVQKNMEVFLNAGRAKINAFKAKRWEEIAN